VTSKVVFFEFTPGPCQVFKLDWGNGKMHRVTIWRGRGGRVAVTIMGRSSDVVIWVGLMNLSRKIALWRVLCHW